MRSRTGGSEPTPEQLEDAASQRLGADELRFIADAMIRKHFGT